jgi:hypothetical protein
MYIFQLFLRVFYSFLFIARLDGVLCAAGFWQRAARDIPRVLICERSVELP